MIRPNFDKLKGLAEKGGLIPISKELLADTETPVSAYLKIRSKDHYAFLLESVEGVGKIGRYSFLGVNPFLIFGCRGRKMVIEDLKLGNKKKIEGNPVVELRKLLNHYRSVHVDGFPRFTGGAVGYVGYDAVRLIEDISDTTTDDLNLEDIRFLFFDTLLAFDNVAHTINLITNVHTEGDLEDNYQAALERIALLEQTLQKPVNRVLQGGESRFQVTSNISRKDYLEKVSRCKEYIISGDIFQVVISQRFETEVTVDSLDVYRMLRCVNPSPYMFHLDLKEFQLVGASPELLVRVEDGVVQVRPIAGTRPRGVDDEGDRVLEEELLTDEKERAEHIMLVDLGRNDVGRVSKFGTVRVTEQMTIEHYSHVMHIVSNVRGQLLERVDALDALFACYPAGTVSGAPKIRAMEIIDELEPTRRGPYAGAVGYIDFSGNMDTCIAIRTMILKGNRAYVQAGGGIVYDSVAENEYQETVNKAKALFRAVEAAESGQIHQNRW